MNVMIAVICLFVGLFEACKDSHLNICAIIKGDKARGVHPPWGNDAFSPFFQIFPYFREISRFCFSHQPQISNFPLFSLFQYIFPLFCENYWLPPYFAKFPPVLEKFTCFYMKNICVYFVSP